MEEQFSLTYIGLIAICLSWLFEKVGVPFVKGDLTTTIEFLMKLFGVITAFYGRFRQGDITLWGLKRKA